MGHTRHPELAGIGGGGTHLSLALVIEPLTMHPLRDGAPFLLLIDTNNSWAAWGVPKPRCNDNSDTQRRMICILLRTVVPAMK